MWLHKGPDPHHVSNAMPNTMRFGPFWCLHISKTRRLAERSLSTRRACLMCRSRRSSEILPRRFAAANTSTHLAIRRPLLPSLSPRPLRRPRWQRMDLSFPCPTTSPQLPTPRTPLACPPTVSRRRRSPPLMPTRGWSRRLAPAAHAAARRARRCHRV